MSDQKWTSTEVLAWSRGDGPERPSAGPSRWALGAVAATLAVTISGILATDTLCPDHRLWVQTLATVAIALSVTSVIQILRAHASAGLFALAASLVGVGIGLIDAVHAPSRGRLIAAAFALAAVASAGIALRLRSLRAWDDRFGVAHTALSVGDAPLELDNTEGVGDVTAVGSGDHARESRSAGH